MVSVCIFIERLARNELHDKVRTALFGGATAQQAADVRMIQRRQDLSFVTKSAEDEISILSGPNQFDRYSMLKFTVSAPRFIDGAHTTASDFSFDPVRANLATYSRFVISVLGGLGLVKFSYFVCRLFH